MNIYALMLSELKERRCAYVHRYPPYYISSIGGHLLNIENKDRKFYYHSGRLFDFRTHPFMIAPPGFCCCAKTEIATPNGHKKASEVQIGEEVFTRNGTSTLVLNKWTKKSECLEFALSPKEKLVCTPEHLILVKREETETWIPAKAVREDDLFVLSPELKVEETTKWSDEQVILLAIWIAEGRFEGITANNTPVIATANEKVLQAVQKCARWFGCRVVETGSLCEYRLSRPERHTNKRNPIRQWMRTLNLRSGCRNKFIPSKVFHLPKSQRQLFWTWLRTCDGYIAGDNYDQEFYSSTSKRLISDVKFLLMTLGKHVSAYKPYKGCVTIKVTDKQTAKVTSISKVPEREVVDFEVDKSSLIANQIIVHNSKSFWLDHFLADDCGLIKDSGIFTGFEGYMTEAGWVGQIRYQNGEVVEKKGAAWEYRNGIVGCEEFAALVEAMKTSHSKQLDVSMLTSLDSGRIRKRVGPGSLPYDTRVTLWSGTQTMRLDLMSGMGRRLLFMVFFPTERDKELLREIYLKGHNIRFNPFTVRKIRAGLDDKMKQVSRIENVEFLPEVKEFFRLRKVIHYEIPIYERLLVGYLVMSQDLGSQLTVKIDEEALKLLKSEMLWRDQIKRGGRIAQVLMILHEHSGTLHINELRAKLVDLAIDWQQSSELIQTMLRARILRLDDHGNLTIWKRRRE